MRAHRRLSSSLSSRPLSLTPLPARPPLRSYIARVGCATRGYRPPARVTALAVGKQLRFARAMLAHDEAGEQAFVD